MQHTASRIDYGTNRKGDRQLRRQWAPVGSPRAIVLMVHGIAEHSGRYEHVGAQFAAAGFGAVAFDQRGHGRTEGRRGYVAEFSEFLDDVEDHLREVRTVGVPVGLIGHSMGGLISTAYSMSDRPAPDMLVLSGPALGTGIPRWQQVAVQKMAQLIPYVFLAPPFDTSVLSRDPAVGEAYDADPLIRPGGTSQLISELIATAEMTAASIGELAVPTLCLHGAADELVPVEASEILEGIPGVTRRALPELRHEIFNEPEGSEIITDVIDWISARL